MNIFKLIFEGNAIIEAKDTVIERQLEELESLAKTRLNMLNRNDEVKEIISKEMGGDFDPEPHCIRAYVEAMIAHKNNLYDTLCNELTDYKRDTEEQTKQFQNRLSILQGEVEDKKSAVARLETALTLMNNSIEDRDSDINAHISEKQQLKDELDALDDMLDKKDDEIKNLEGVIEDKTKAVNEFTEQIMCINDIISTSLGVGYLETDTIAGLKGLIASRDADIAKLTRCSIELQEKVDRAIRMRFRGIINNVRTVERAREAIEMLEHKIHSMENK